MNVSHCIVKNFNKITSFVLVTHMHWCELRHIPPPLWACLLLTTYCVASEKPQMFNNSPFPIHHPHLLLSGLSASSFECQAFAPAFIPPGHGWGYGNCWTLWCSPISLLWTREIHLLKSSHPPPSFFSLSPLFLSSKTNKQSPFPPSHQSTGSFLCTSRGINPPSGLPDCSGSRHSNQSWTLKMPAQHWKISSV